MNLCDECDKRKQCHEEGRLIEYFCSEDMPTFTTHMTLKIGEHCPYKNCHSYCIYAKQCRYLEGKAGQDPEECYMYYKIEDIIADARDAAAEERRIKEEEEREYDE